jgi:hypothetical protein
MIVGYGFGDEHINAVIEDAVKNAGLKLFIWNRGVKSILDREDLRSFVTTESLIDMSADTVAEVFPPDQEQTEEYKRIFSRFFGYEAPPG